MAVITPDRFDPTKAFCDVRLQAGVPLVDADVNELDDIRKFEERSILKWFAGDGVPNGNDGFRIDAPAVPASDDFQIRVGAQSLPASPEDAARPHTGAVLRNFGRCVVDGLDVILQKDVTYKGQPLFAAAALGVPQVAAIPGASVFVLVYLDVWERLVTPTEDGTLVVPQLATESCARIKREWVIRTRTLVSAAAPSAPVPGDPDFSGDNKHSYYALALLTRRFVAGALAPLLPTDITDLRDRGLVLPPSNLVTDVLGVDPVQYRRGVGRPAVSLREAINALLRGERPGPNDLAITPGTATSNDVIARAFVFDGAGGLNAFWTSWRPDQTALPQIYSARLDPTNPAGGFVLPGMPQGTAAGMPPTPHSDPHAVTLPTGDILVVYGMPQSQPAPRSIFFKRVPPGGSLSAATEQTIVSSPSAADRVLPFVVLSTLPTGGGYVVFFFRNPASSPGSNNATMMFLRRLYTASWLEAEAQWVAADGGGVALSTPYATSLGAPPHAVASPDGNVWVAFSSAAIGGTFNAQVVRLTVATGMVLTCPGLPPTWGALATYISYFVLIDGSGVVWVFCETNLSNLVLYQQYTSAGAPIGTPQPVPGALSKSGMTAALDRRGGVWLFGTYPAAPFRIWCTRWSPVTHAWGSVSQITGPAPNDLAQISQYDYLPFVMLGPTGALWLFWQRQISAGGEFAPGVANLFFRQILIEI